MSLTVVVVVISSPATTTRSQRNSWRPWTSIAKTIPTSGSNSAGVIARAGVDDREHRRRDEVGVTGGAGRLEVEMQRVGLPHRGRVLADLLAPDRVEVDGG